MEEWEGLVQMDCLQRAAVPVACFTSPLSAALIFPLTAEERGEEHWPVGAGMLTQAEQTLGYVKCMKFPSKFYSK